MALDLTHKFISPVPHNGDARLVQGPHWNDQHNLLTGPQKLVGRADSTPGQAEATEIAIDPDTMAFIDGKLSALGDVPVSYRWRIGTGDPAIDTPALQDAIDSADGRTVYLSGTFRVRWTDNILFNFADKAAYPAYAAVILGVDNIHLAGPATIKFEAPSFAYEAKARFLAFSTLDHANAFSIRNILFEDIIFDFEETIGSPLPSWTESIYVAGGAKIECRHCRWTVTPQVVEVTITADGTNQAVVTWPSPGHPMSGKRGFIYFDGPDLPPEILPGEELYIRRIDDMTHNVSAIDTGALRTITPGTYTATAHGRNQAGLGVWLANTYGYRGANNKFEYVKQSYYCHFVYGINLAAEEHRYLTEAYDFDCEVEGGSIVDCVTEDLNGDAQPIDGSPLRNFTITGMRCHATRSAMFAYTKVWANGDYGFFRKHHLAHDNVMFGIGAPGTCSIPEADLVEGTRIWFEDTSLLTPATFPTCTVSGGALASTGGTIKWNTVFVRNPVGQTCNLSQTDGGPLIDISAAGSGLIRARCMPDPATVKPSSAVVVTGLVVTSPISEASDDDNHDDPSRDAIGKHVMFVGHNRKQVAGTNREQYLRGVPRQTENIQLIGCDITGGNRVFVGDCDGFSMMSCKLRDQIPGTDGTLGAAIVLMQGGANSNPADTSSRTEGILRAVLRDVEVVNTTGMGVRVIMPTNLDIDGLTVRQFNSQAHDDTRYGMHLSHAAWANAHVNLGRMDMVHGVNGSTQPVRQIRMIASGSNPDGAGSLRLRTVGPFHSHTAAVGAIHISTDLGAWVTNKVTVPISVDTTSATGAAAVQIAVWYNEFSRGQVVYATIVNAPSIVASATNYTRVRLRRITANGGTGTLADVSGAINFDFAAVNASTSRDLAVSGLDLEDTINTDDTLILEATRIGTGSKVSFSLNLTLVPYSAGA